MRQVKRIAGAGIVDVMALFFRQEAVVGRVINPFERQCGPEMVSFCCVVVNNVEYDFDAGVVKTGDHLLEFGEGKVRNERIAPRGSKKRYRVVAPIVSKSLV